MGQNQSSTGPKHQFFGRFLDLPPELRNRVYSYILPGPNNIQSRNLAKLNFPPITRASRQLRQESLSFLFAECNMVLLVGSDLHVRKLHRTKAMIPYYKKKLEISSAGTLGFKNVVRSFLNDAGNSAIFKDISFEVYPPSFVVDLRYGRRPFGLPDRAVKATHIVSLNLKVVKGSLEVAFIMGPCGFHHRAWGFDNTIDQVDVDATLDKVVRIARRLAGRENFIGFNIRDLREIARGFRCG